MLVGDITPSGVNSHRTKAPRSNSQAQQGHETRVYILSIVFLYIIAKQN